MDSTDSLAFRDKIGTNYIPLPSEIAEIKQLLVSPRAEIERIDREIAQLEARRLELSTYVSEHEALISPVRQLPLDIMREIFIACIPTDQNPIMSAQTAPLLLGHICSAWRAIAFSTPRLWSSIHVAEPHKKLPQHIHDECLQLVKAWLTRSGALPLSISFYRPPSLDPSPLFDAILSFSARWKNISFSGQNGIRLLRSDVPLLQTIEMLHYPVGDEPVGVETHDFFNGVGVRKISIGTNMDPIQLPLPWHQLTTLSLERFNDPNNLSLTRQWSLSSSTALKILARCHSLRECALCLSTGAHETVDVPASVELPLLVSLNISVAHGAMSALQQHNPLDRLVSPQLSLFALKGYSRNSVGFPFPTLISTATKMKSVEVNTMLFTAETFATFLRQLPASLQRLLLRQNVVGPSAPAFVDNEFLRLLAATSESANGPFLFPELETIELAHAAKFSDEELLCFIRARMEIHPLRRIGVDFYRDMEVDILPQLQSFIDGFGLDVSLKYRRNKIRWTPHDGMANWANFDDAVFREL
ncbi:hypothetical protein B0H19DRAFT_1109701 [Mycena capillaripes]|nr:hypothetical protein B0H19DRAFT_1109701 [Mycena capillaripes]